MHATAHEMIQHYGPCGLFVLLMLGIVGMPVPDETLLTAAGVLIRNGKVDPVTTFITALLGSACGITISYVLGRTIGWNLIHRYGPLFRVTDTHLERFHRWYARFGRWTLVFGYFVPGVRHIVAVAAGASELNWSGFALFAYSGALLWVMTFLTGGYLLGAQWQHLSAHAHRAIMIGGGILLLALLVHTIRRRFLRGQA